MTDLRPVIRSERRALLHLLESLTDDQWVAPSLCRGWTVQDVAAHLAWAPAYTPLTLAADLARAGLRPNKAGHDSARRWAGRGRDAILDQLRTNVARDAKPPGVPRVASLVDAVVHALDVRRPLGLPRPVPGAAFVPAADFCARTRWPASVMVGGDVATRISGLRLVADDASWTYGDGPEVRAAGDTLLLVLTGRPVGPDELRGPGSGDLRARLGQ